MLLGSCPVFSGVYDPDILFLTEKISRDKFDSVQHQQKAFQFSVSCQ